MMDTDQHRRAAAATLERTGLSVQELWLRCLALGGVVAPVELEAYLHGLLEIPPVQQDILSQALNEELAELGLPAQLGYSFSSRETRRRADRSDGDNSS